MKKKLIAEDNRKQAIGTAIILLVVFIFTGLVMYWMYTVDLLRVPDWAAKLFGIGGPGAGDLPWDLGELSEIVDNGKSPDDATLTLDLTYENLVGAFLTEEQAEGIYVNARVSYYDDGEEVPHRVIYRRRGDEFRAEIYETNSTAKLDTLKIRSGSSMYVRDAESGKFRSMPFNPTEFSPEHEAGIPSVAEILAAVENFPMPDVTGAVDDSTETIPEAPEDYTDCQLSMITTDEGSVYYVEFTYADLGIREEYYISLDYGIVLSAKTVSRGQPVYAYETLSFSLDAANWDKDSFYSVTG
ncbi:MAG: hypothetical protein E7632_13175 [Ruminococcaceae bacterium]|nr:hypothetical protein [Oscillospiraceae bacterium]